MLRSAVFPARVSGHVPESILAELEAGVLKETDYLNEGQNIEFFRERLKPLPFVRVPFVHWDLSTDRILTMSFISGEPLPDFLAEKKPSQEVRNQIGARLLKLYDLQLHRIHSLHADPHPGNYLIERDGMIGLMDFGCVKKFTADFVELIRAFEQRAWLDGEVKARRIAELIWGREILNKPRVASKLLKATLDFYEMLFPAAATGGTVVDFGDAKIMNSMVRIWKESLRSKAVNPEFAFYQRAEMGLYNLLHLLRAKINTSTVVANAGAFKSGQGSVKTTMH